MKFNLVQYEKRLYWYLNMREQHAEDKYQDFDSTEPPRLVSDIQNHIDQNTSMSLQEEIGSDVDVDPEWIEVNGVIRRYGFSL